MNWEDEKFLMEDDIDYEYEQRRRARIRRRQMEKRRQMRRRRIMKLVAIAVIFVSVIGLGGSTLVRAIINKTKEAGEKAVVEVQAKSVDDPNEAVRQPIVDANNTAKLEAVSTGWQTNESGTWYQNTDGSYFVSGWKEIEGSKYYFDDNGYLVTGWLELDGQDYFFNEEGVYDASVKKPMVALTFDDGPGEYTDMLLDCLEENNAKATFFMLGQNVERFPEQARREYELGMEIGNHTYDHQILTNTELENVSPEVTKTQDVLTTAAGAPATVMRPPGGAYNDEVLSQIGLPVIMWSIDTKDWKTRDVQNTIDVTLNNVTDGSIVLMHDIHQPTVEAACQIIPELISRGYKLVTVSELAAAKGITLENGGVYSYFGEGEQMVE